MSTQDPRIEALDQLRARRDEVEKMLLELGWHPARLTSESRWWYRRDFPTLWTPPGEPTADTAEQWASLLDRTAAIAVKPIGAVADSPKPAPHDAARDWAALVGAESSEIPTDAHPVIATLDTILRLKAQMQRERAEAKAEIDRLTAALDYERQQANEALSQLHDAKEAAKAVRAALFAVLDVKPDNTETSRLLVTIRHLYQTLRKDYLSQNEESREAVHLLMLLGIKPAALPDMITALLPPERLFRLRIRNESQARLALDNLALQGVPETDPRMVEAVARYREAVALRVALEKADHSPEVGNMVEAE
jgi:hypothetical protein